MNHPETSLTLLERARAGTDVAWRELQSLYTPLGYYWCRQSGVRAQDTEEIWANVLGRVARKLEDFEHNGRPGAFRKWLRTITHNEIVDFQRSQQRTVTAQGLIEEHAVEPARNVDPSEEVSILYHRAWEMIRGEFSQDHCDIFRRIVEHGERPGDVADDCGLQRATIYTILARIRGRLRERFDGELDES